MPTVLKEQHCLRCDHKWFPRKAGKPKTCANPECRSRDWQKARKEPKLKLVARRATHKKSAVAKATRKRRAA